MSSPPNPFLQPWSGPFGGIPPLHLDGVADFEAAIEAVLAEERAAVDAIVANPAPPTFENTIVALERAGAIPAPVAVLFLVHNASRSTPELRALRARVAPKLSAHGDEIVQNPALFERIRAVWDARAGLSPEDERLVWVRWQEFVRAGALLPDDAKARVKAINAELATLYTKFSSNLLADEESQYTEVPPDALRGVPASLAAALAAAAASRGLQGWVVPNTRSAVEPFLTYAEDRAVREAVWRRFTSRGDTPGPTDNKPIVAEILKLRAERARLLGYATHAHWRLDGNMARTPERALALLEAVWGPARERALAEISDMQALADAEGAGFQLAPWDHRHYAERVRKARFDVDHAAIRPYLQLDRLMEGMFWVAGELFGLSFDRLEDVPLLHPTMSAWRVRRGEQHVGLFYFDPLARPGKRSGAWASGWRPQRRAPEAFSPIISNNLNFVAGAPGEPTLLSWDDARTLFHEFGHGLHGLLSDVTWGTLAGTAVFRDFVELPSQLLERWMETTELLERFAVDNTGAPLPVELRERLRAAGTFNQGFATTELLGSALVDMALHLAPEPPADPEAFEREILARYGMPEAVGTRHRVPHFAHLFSNEGYAAGYYSYLWADVLVADAAEAFEAAPGGFYDAALAERLRVHILSAGNTRDPGDAYRAFLGRDADIGALLRDRGFAPPLA